MDKRWNFFIVVIICSLFILFKIKPTPVVRKNIKMTITQNRGTIKNLDQKKSVLKKKTYFIDTLKFEIDRKLKHTRLGVLPFSKDFFIDFHTHCEVIIPGKYNFIILSDDGFRMLINDVEIGAYTGERFYEKTKISLFLNKGRYKITLNYFQGSGALGLKAYYMLEGIKKKYLIGKSSNYIKFMRYGS